RPLCHTLNSLKLEKKTLQSRKKTKVQPAKKRMGHRLGWMHYRHKEHDTAAMIFLPLVAEYFGTLIFVFIVTGGWFQMQYWAIQGGVSPLDSPIANPLSANIFNALVFLLGFAAPAAAFIDVSGAHFNPAVSMMSFLVGGISFWRFIWYSFFQLAGAITASAIVYGIVPSAMRSVGTPSIQTLLDSTQVNPAFGYVTALGVEIMISFILGIVWLRYTHFHNRACSVDKPKIPALVPLIIGGTYAVNQFVGLSISGASMNPARSFGPFVISGFVMGSYQWIYWVGPAVGMIGAAFISSIFEYFFSAGWYTMLRMPFQGGVNRMWEKFSHGSISDEDKMEFAKQLWSALERGDGAAGFLDAGG